METIKIGLLGVGTVGGAAYDILTRNRDLILQRTGIDYEVRRVLEISQKNIEKHHLDPSIVTANVDEVIQADDIDIVVECIGGSEPAATWMVTAMENGKSVVTPNKAVVAAQFQRFEETAKKNNVEFRYEAAVGGGIPELTAITDQLAGNTFHEVSGIVNGTTNYILTMMEEAGMSYEDALKQAQEKGFAEADPTADVEGIDCANKLTILMKLCFDKYVAPADIPRTGITKITMDDIEAAKARGNRIKLLAQAEVQEDGSLKYSVEPTELPLSHPLSGVSHEFNAIYVTGDWCDELMFYGKGAGPATGSAIVGDVIHIMRDLRMSGRA